MESRTQTVDIDMVIADSRCQSRTGIDLGLVHDYAEAISEGTKLPPLSTIHTPDGYYLYDGFHRLEAYRQAGKNHVVVETEPGDIWDAIERSCAVNAIHGKRRTPADTKRAVEKVLEVMQHRGVKWSQVEIADKCAISRPRVTQLLGNELAHLSSKYLQDRPTTVTRNGATYEMNTANIGKRPAKPLDPGPELVNEDTGEILDDGPPPAEEVDPSDPATFREPMRPRMPQPKPSDPVPAPRASMDTIEFQNYGPDFDNRTARSMAVSIASRFGDGFANRLATELRRTAKGAA